MVGCRWGAVLPFVAMVMVEFTDVVVSTISKAAMSRGMSSYVFVVYSNALATLFLLPCFVFQKKPVSLTLSLLCGFFLLGLIGSLSLILAYNGINYSSPTLASAMGNLIPIYTFMLAVIFRMEKVDLKRSSSQAKLSGTIISVSGAFVVILYKGSAIINFTALSPSNIPRLHLNISQHMKWVFGGIFLAISCLLAAMWNIFQASFVNNCPSKLTIVFFYTFFVTIQCTIYSLVVERNPNSWVLRPDIEMIAIVCSAVLGSLFRIGVHTWCLHQKGPIFVAMFRPLGVAIAAVMVIIFLGEALHLGSVIGSIIIAIGFYAMIWAQIKEKSTNMENEVHSLASSTQQAPLLQCRATGKI